MVAGCKAAAHFAAEPVPHAYTAARFDRGGLEPAGEALHISQRALQNYRDRGIIPYSTIGSKFYYRETDVERVIREALIRR